MFEKFLCEKQRGVCERRDLSSANIGELPWKALFAASFNVFLSSHAVVRACRQHGPHQHTGRGREVTYLSQRHTPHRPKITTGHLISCCQHHVLTCHFFVSLSPSSSLPHSGLKGDTSGLILSDNEPLALIYSFMLIWLTFHFSALPSPATDRVGPGRQ